MRHLPPLPALFLAAAVVAGCGGGDSNGPGNQPQADVSIVPGAFNKGFQAYSPDTLTISLATSGTVTWRNDDGGVAHTVTDTTAAALFDLGLTAINNDTASFTFTVAGEYPYMCTIHPGMRGLIVVNP
ncbi:MAG: hypothetical protein SF070_05605 [Gemmatimonadota bacterium]|nr:hypothetical protein [Gemmatimonadota bacterium]